MSWDVCRICLAGNVKMFSIANTQLQDIYEKITSNQWNIDSRLDAICYLCHSQLRTSYKLLVMSKQSEEIFTHLFAEGFEFTEQTVPILHKQRLRKLLVTPVEGFTVGNISHSCNSAQDITNTMQEEVSVKIEEISDDNMEGITSVEQNGDTNETTKEEVITNAPCLTDEITDIVVSRNPNKGIKSSPNKKDVNQIASLQKDIIEKDTIQVASEDKLETVGNIPSKDRKTREVPKIKVAKNHGTIKRVNTSSANIDRNANKEEIRDKKTLDHNTSRPLAPKDTVNEVANEVNKDSKTNKIDIKHESCQQSTNNNKRSVSFKLRFTVTNPHERSKSRTKKRVNPFVNEKSPNEELDVTTHTCNVCDQSFDSKQTLEKHVIIKHEEKPHICGICERAFTLESDWVLHQNTHNKPYVCEKCPETFSRLRHLNKHLHIHNEINLYACKVCEKSFNQQSNLQQHMRIHTGEKPYACAKCNKRFKQKSNLIQHERVHTKEKPYSCDICNKKFGQLSNLQQHTRIIHIKEKPFKCNFCLKAFYQKSNLLQHIGRSHFKDEKYTT